MTKVVEVYYIAMVRGGRGGSSLLLACARGT